LIPFKCCQSFTWQIPCSFFLNYVLSFSFFFIKLINLHFHQTFDVNITMHNWMTASKYHKFDIVNTFRSSFKSTMRDNM
jgi:hypothetical protein